MAFSRNLTALLRDYGLAQYEAAAAFGVSLRALRDWRSGRSNPSLKHAEAVASFFELTLSMLLTGTADEIEAAARGRRRRSVERKIAQLRREAKAEVRLTHGPRGRPSDLADTT